LNEIAANPAHRLITAIWDGVEIEKRLSEPRGFAVAHIFFPKSMGPTPWRIYNMGSPSKWAAHYGEYFMYLSCRISAHFPSMSEVEVIVKRLKQIRPTEADELVRPRAVYFDDKHGQFFVFADYLVPQESQPSLLPRDFENILHDGQGLHVQADAMWYLTSWDVQLVRTLPWSDRFQPDDSSYYDRYLRHFEVGTPRGLTIGELAELNAWL
jgi:hypothetical protein